MKSKNDLIKLIESKCIEQDLLAFSKARFIIFGEVYSNLKMNILYFPSFQLKMVQKIKNGSIDFVVFRYLSRMDVILIEIKGANFNSI